MSGWLGLALSIALGCGGAPARPPVRSSPALGALHTLVPPGSTLVVLARPRELMRTRATQRVVAAVFPSDQLDAFARRTGVDPRAMTELVVASHPEGRLIVARGRLDAALAVREAGERMAPIESSVDRPFVRRVGFLGDRRVDLTALAPDTVSWVEGTPQLAARILTQARRPASRRQHALASIAVLRRDIAEDAPLVLYAPEPLGLPLDSGIGVLLARERALAVTVRAIDPRTLRLSAELHGEFPPGAQENFRALAHAIAEDDLGAALGARDALPTLRIVAEDRRIRLSAEVDAGVLASGLRTLLVAEMRELLEPRRPSAAGGTAPVITPSSVGANPP